MAASSEDSRMAVGYAYSILGDFHWAQDAAQEAFIEAYGNLYQLREPAAFAAWLRRIIILDSINRLILHNSTLWPLVYTYLMPGTRRRGFWESILTPVRKHIRIGWIGSGICSGSKYRLLQEKVR